MNSEQQRYHSIGTSIGDYCTIAKMLEDEIGDEEGGSPLSCLMDANGNPLRRDYRHCCYYQSREFHFIQLVDLGRMKEGEKIRGGGEVT